MAGDGQLLDTARDCFHFVVKFFEPISASATHIYHSALELCPLSSVVRKLYYDRYHGTARLPRLVIGTPDSWNPIVSFSGKDAYKFCAWSPCGRFVAAQTENSIEIRNQLTFELLTVLHPTNNTSPPTSPLAYSPDGRSLASGLSNTIVIWDIQTGGVAKGIKCCWVIVSIVWSLDGTIVAVVLRSKKQILHVETYEIASGARLFAGEIGLKVGYWHLWAHDQTFRFVTIPPYAVSTSTFNMKISEIGAIPTKIESFTAPTGLRSPGQPPRTAAFSPSTYRVSFSDTNQISIVDVRSSVRLFGTESNLVFPQFSPDGSFFTAFRSHNIYTWKFTSGCYNQWGNSIFHSDPKIPDRETSLHFSPTSSSILVHCRKSLRIRRLDNPPTASQPRRQRAAISRLGTHIATAYHGERTIAIINIPSQAPSQFIDTSMEIQGLVITGNVLLVAGWRRVEAWLLTEEGMVDGVFGNKRAGHNDRIWSITPSHGVISFSVHGQFGVIHDDAPYIYHTETGNILDCAHKPEDESDRRKDFLEQSDVLQHHCRSYYKAPPQDGWLVSHDTMPGVGWVMDPEGRHRFWIPFEWRGSLSSWNWFHDIATLFTDVENQPIIVKF